MLRFMDGFDAYATAQMLLGRWTSLAQAGVAASGRHGGNALVTTDANSGNVQKAIGGTASTIIAGFALYVANFNRSIMALREGATTHIELRTDASGHLVVTRAGTVLGTSTATISSGVYNYVEVKATIHDTTGAVEVRLNSVVILTITGADTRNGGTGFIDTIVFGFVGLGQTDQSMRIDDLYVCDDTGAQNNNYLGDIRCEALVPTGVGNYAQWTPSVGANWQNVDEKPPTDDTDYNSSATAAQKDTFAYGDLSAATGTVYAVQHLLYRRKDDAGSRTLRPLTRISAVDYNGSTVAVPDTYSYDAQIVELSPATAAAWTVAEVNGAEFGYELVA